MNLKLVLILLLSSLAVVFIAQNASVVEVAFLFWRLSISAALLIFFTLMIGFILGWILHAYLAHRKIKRDAIALH
jgi:uncharacterized integral membrane protein